MGQRTRREIKSCCIHSTTSRKQSVGDDSHTFVVSQRDGEKVANPTVSPSQYTTSRGRIVDAFCWSGKKMLLIPQ